MASAGYADSMTNRSVLIAIALFSLACSRGAERPASQPAVHTTTLPARTSTDTGTGSDDGQWRMPARNFASTRYSGLGQITAQNVGHLQLAWTFSTGVTRGHEAGPLVVDSTMYVVTPFPNILYAL